MMRVDTFKIPARKNATIVVLQTSNNEEMVWEKWVCKNRWVRPLK
jgi:hypothetical protein